MKRPESSTTGGASFPASPVGHLPIGKLNIGMLARVTHPKYASEYPDPLPICGIELHPAKGENISLLDNGGMVDGWKSGDLYILPNTQ